jgi:hypothetical protein
MQISNRQNFQAHVHSTILHQRFRNRAPIRDANTHGSMQRFAEQRMGMREQQRERLEIERAEIAARVAIFKATQEKFERERDEYFVTTLRNACATGPLPFWSCHDTQTKARSVGSGLRLHR